MQTLKRRTAVKVLAASAFTGRVFSAKPDGFDQFGGWKGRKFEATGFFRVEKAERWWLVTPAGNAFLSFGFNRTYETSFGSFDALAAAVNWRLGSDLSNPNETRDNIEFLHAAVARYYETARNAIRRHDPNHLFVGDKLNGNTDSVDTVLRTTARFTDLVFYQMYGRYEVQQPGLERWSKIVDKPIINGDSAFTMITDTMPRPYGPVADSLKQRAEWTDEFFRSAFARPEFIGWHYCGLINATNRIFRKKARQHSGLLDGFGEPYPALKACADELYDIGTRNL